jgi:hypothetical protein
MTPTFLAGRPEKARPLDSGFPRRQVRNHTVALRRAGASARERRTHPLGGPTGPDFTRRPSPHPAADVRPRIGDTRLGGGGARCSRPSSDPPGPGEACVQAESRPGGRVSDPFPTPSDRPQSLRSSQTWRTGSGIAPHPSPLNRAQSLCSSQIRPGGAEILLAPKSDVLPVAFQGMRTKRPASLQAGLRLARHTQGGVPRTPARARHVTESLLGPVPIRVRLRPPLRRDLPVPTGVIDLPAPRRPGGRAWRGNQFLQAVQGGYGRA